MGGMRTEDIQRQMLHDLSKNLQTKTESSIGKTSRATARKSFPATKTIVSAANVDPKNKERSSSSSAETSKSLSKCVKVPTGTENPYFSGQKKSVLSDKQPAAVAGPNAQKHTKLLDSMRQRANRMTESLRRNLMNQKNIHVDFEADNSPNVSDTSTGMKIDEEMFYPNETEGGITEESIAQSDEDDTDYPESDVGSQDYSSLDSLNASGSYLDVGKDDDAEDGCNLWLDDSSEELHTWRSTGNINGSAEDENVLTETAIQSLPLTPIDLTSSTRNDQQHFPAINCWLDSRGISSSTVEDDVLPRIGGDFSVCGNPDSFCLSWTDKTAMTKSTPVVSSVERVVSSTHEIEEIDGLEFHTFESEADMVELETIQDRVKNSVVLTTGSGVKDVGEESQQIIATDADATTEVKGRRKEMKKIGRRKLVQGKSGGQLKTARKRTQRDPKKIQKKKMKLKLNKITQNEEQNLDVNTFNDENLKLMNDSVPIPKPGTVYRLRPRKSAVYTNPFDDLLDDDYSDAKREDDENYFRMLNEIDEPMAVALTSRTGSKEPQTAKSFAQPSQEPFKTKFGWFQKFGSSFIPVGSVSDSEPTFSPLKPTYQNIQEANCTKEQQCSKIPNSSLAEDGLITQELAVLAVTAAESEDHLTSTSDEELSSDGSYRIAEEVLESSVTVSENAVAPHSLHLQDERRTNGQIGYREDSATPAAPMNQTQSERVVKSDEGVAKRRRLSRPPARLMDLDISCKSQKDLPLLPETVRERMRTDLMAQMSRRRTNDKKRSRRRRRRRPAVIEPKISPAKMTNLKRNSSTVAATSQSVVVKMASSTQIKKSRRKIIRELKYSLPFGTRTTVLQGFMDVEIPKETDVFAVIRSTEIEPGNRWSLKFIGHRLDSKCSECWMEVEQGAESNQTRLSDEYSPLETTISLPLKYSDPEKHIGYVISKQVLNNAWKFANVVNVRTPAALVIADFLPFGNSPGKPITPEFNIHPIKDSEDQFFVGPFEKILPEENIVNVQMVVGDKPRNVLDMVCENKNGQGKQQHPGPNSVFNVVCENEDPAPLVTKGNSTRRKTNKDLHPSDGNGQFEMKKKKKKRTSKIKRIRQKGKRRPIAQLVSREAAPVAWARDNKLHKEEERLRRLELVQGFNKLYIALHPTTRNVDQNFKLPSKVGILRQALKCFEALEEQSRKLEREKRVLKNRCACLLKQYSEIVKKQPNSEIAIQKMKLQLKRGCQPRPDGANVEMDLKSETLNAKDDQTKSRAHNKRSTLGLELGGLGSDARNVNNIPMKDNNYPDNDSISTQRHPPISDVNKEMVSSQSSIYYSVINYHSCQQSLTEIENQFRHFRAGMLMSDQLVVEKNFDNDRRSPNSFKTFSSTSEDEETPDLSMYVEEEEPQDDNEQETMNENEMVGTRLQETISNTDDAVAVEPDENWLEVQQHEVIEECFEIVVLRSDETSVDNPQC